MKKAILYSIIILFVFTTCNKDKEIEEVKDPTKDYMEYTNQGIIGAGGGKVQVVDPNNSINNSFVDIPAGAISSNQLISVKASTKENWFEGSDKKLFVSFEPSGIEFSNPVKIGVPYKSDEDPDNVKVYYYDDKKFIWNALPTISNDKTKRILTAETNHFSEYVATSSQLDNWQSFLYYNNNKISGGIKLLTPLNKVPTNYVTLVNFGKNNIHDLLTLANADVRAVFYVSLMEKLFIGSKLVETVEFKYRIKTREVPTTDAYQVFGEDKNSNQIYDSGPNIPLTEVEKIYSGEPVLFRFNTVPNPDSKYYLSCDLYYLDKNSFENSLTGMWTYTGLHYSGAASAISGMLNPPDKDNDAIIDSFDKVYGNSPAAPSNPTPANNATDISTTLTLSWECSDPENDPLTYDVYFGTDNPPVTKASNDEPGKTLVRSGLMAGTTYYWKVIAKDSKGNTTEGVSWKFTTQASQGFAPVADFTISKTNPIIGETIKFTDKSTNSPTSWLWNFGDGTTSNVQNPSKTFNSAGNYTVLLKAANSFGSNTKTINFTVSESGGSFSSLFDMVLVEGGTFQMGSTSGYNEQPVHTVTVSSFKISKTEVTQALWRKVMGDNYSFNIGNELPVEQVSWFDAQLFIQKLNELTKMDYRLPTEAEWEFAARGGKFSKGYTYSGSNNIDDVAWYSNNSGGKTQPVATKLPNELGLYDMNGNVWEWCNDVFENYSGSAQTNPVGPSSGNLRVIRGGGFRESIDRCRVSVRDAHHQGTLFKEWGFRIAQSYEGTGNTGSVPSADFSASKTAITKGETIQFTDKSTNSPTSWLWDFGDNTTSNFQNPSKTYNSAGNYTVSLKATNSYGDNTKTMNITVNNPPIETSSFTDNRDGKTYKTVKIGNQWWMAENLAYLPAVSPKNSESYTMPHYYVHGYDGSDVEIAKQQANYNTYGVLYNWPAAKAACPSNWHLPTDAEWTVLENYLIANGFNYDETTTGNKITKSLAATTIWCTSSNTGAIGNNLSLNNKSGFSALPCGSRYSNYFSGNGFSGNWWSSTEESTSFAWYRYLHYDKSSINRHYNQKKYGFSVRCVRD